MLALLVVCYSYSYSEVIHDTTQNAAINGQQWVMSNVLPGYTGLTVNSISYQYTTLKEAQDQMIVSIQNQQAGGNGLVFNSTDDWSGLPGNTIRKVVTVAGIPYYDWGDGQIMIEGTGTVTDPNVQYNYSYDPCNDNPLYSPSCPGYALAMANLHVKQSLEKIETNQNYDISVDYSISKTELPSYYTEETRLKKPKDLDDEDAKDRKKRGLQSAENALTEANAISQQEILNVMNFVPQFQSYYNVMMRGGVYADATMYKPTTVPENKKGLRVGLAQQLLHNRMVEEQYNR